MRSPVSNSPNSLPRSSVFNLPIVSSNQMRLPPNVDEPTLVCLMLLMGCGVKVLPCAVRPLIANSPKLYGKTLFFALAVGLCGVLFYTGIMAGL